MLYPNFLLNSASSKGLGIYKKQDLIFSRFQSIPVLNNDVYLATN